MSTRFGEPSLGKSSAMSMISLHTNTTQTHRRFLAGGGTQIRTRSKYELGAEISGIFLVDSKDKFSEVILVFLGGRNKAHELAKK